MTSLGSTVPPNIASKIPPNTLQILDALDGLPGNLSQPCVTTLLAIATSPEFLKCVTPGAFLPILPIISDPNFFNSLKQNPKKLLDYIPQFDQFSDIICNAPKCSDGGVQNATNAITVGCKDDLSNKNAIADLIYFFVVFYSPVRDITCFKDKKEYCKDETAKVVINLPQSPLNITGNPLLDSVAVADPGSICTRCNKDIVNTLFNFLKNNKPALDLLAQAGIDQKHIDEMKIGVAVKCGINFE
ncbi:7707_t:CDS:1, partial [Dentiscutata erythropus]